MKETLTIFNSILYHELKPWLSANNSEKKFTELLSSKLRENKDKPIQFFIALTKSAKKHGFVFTVPQFSSPENSGILNKFANDLIPFECLKPHQHINKITEFYLYLIANERIRILHELIINVDSSRNAVNAAYKVRTLLKEVVQMIKDTANFHQTSKVSVYVLNALKLALIKLNEEIRCIYPTYSEKVPFTIYEALEFVAPEYESDKNTPAKIAFIISQFLTIKEGKQTSALSAIADNEQKKQKLSDKPDFIPKKTDFRTGYKGKLSYEDIVNAALFTKVEEYLYNYDFIDLDYNFTNKHNKKNELAAIFKILIDKKYFKEKNFKHQSKFRGADYRQYLDNRYNVDTSQQFRKCSPQIIISVSDSYHWLDTLQACR
jgi:hypothetical protein